MINILYSFTLIVIIFSCKSVNFVVNNNISTIIYDLNTVNKTFDWGASLPSPEPEEREIPDIIISHNAHPPVIMAQLYTDLDEIKEENDKIIEKLVNEKEELIQINKTLQNIIKEFEKKIN